MKLIAYSSSESGGMLGGRSSKSIAYTDDGRCKVKISGKTFHSEPIKHVTYYADGLLDKLSEVCERYNVISWTDLPDQTIAMHDAAKSRDSFTFENGTIITLSSEKQYPKQAREMYGELNRLIEESESYGVDAEVTIEENSFATMGMMSFQTAGPVQAQKVGTQGEDVSQWAKVCACCGTKFEGNQKFCAECGAVRQKL